jgi:hypothetical protein
MQARALVLDTFTRLANATLYLLGDVPAVGTGTSERRAVMIDACELQRAGDDAREALGR